MLMRPVHSKYDEMSKFCIICSPNLDHYVFSSRSLGHLHLAPFPSPSSSHYPLGGSQSQQPHQYGGGGGVFDHHHHHRQPQHHQHQHHQHQHHQHLSLPRVGYPLRKSSSRGSDNSIGNAADLILGTGMPIGDVISSRRSSEGGDLVFRSTRVRQ